MARHAALEDPTRIFGDGDRRGVAVAQKGRDALRSVGINTQGREGREREQGGAR